MPHDLTNPAAVADRPPMPRRLDREERRAWDAAMPRLSAAGVTDLALRGAEVELLVDAWCGLVRAKAGWRRARDGTTRSTWKRLAEARRNDVRSVAAMLRTESGEPLDIAAAADDESLDAALDALFGATTAGRAHAAV